MKYKVILIEYSRKALQKRWPVPRGSPTAAGGAGRAHGGASGALLAVVLVGPRGVPAAWSPSWRAAPPGETPGSGLSALLGSPLPRGGAEKWVIAPSSPGFAFLLPRTLLGSLRHG